MQTAYIIQWNSKFEKRNARNYSYLCKFTKCRNRKTDSVILKNYANTRNVGFTCGFKVNKTAVIEIIQYYPFISWVSKLIDLSFEQKSKIRM